MEIVREILFLLWTVIKSIVVGTIYTIMPAPKKSIRGEIVLVTGGGSGIGQLMCVEFAKRGAIIVSWDISTNGNNQTASKVKEVGGKIHTFICDVSKKEDVKKVAQQTKNDVGDVTILVNNAGVVNGKKFLDTPDDLLVRTMDINVMAHYWTLKEFLPLMVERNHGHIVTIASLSGLIGTAGLADYTATKFANVGFTESLFYELRSTGADNIHTTTVCPYKIDTGMFEGCQERFPKLMPSMTPDYVAKRIVGAVLINQNLVLLPRMNYFFHTLKTLLPVEASLAMQEFMGANRYMDTFVGRQKKD